nr:unnamed protein product [Callosobruchus analis]
MEMLDKIVGYTNILFAMQSYDLTKYRTNRPLDIIELKALLGILYITASKKSNRQNAECSSVQNRWGSMEIYRLTMSLKKKILIPPQAHSCLNVAGINSYIIYKANLQKIVPRKKFPEDLGYELLQEHNVRRSLQQTIPRTIRWRLTESYGGSVENIPTQNQTHERCAFCNGKKSRKTRFVCTHCRKYMCLEHLTELCTIAMPEKMMDEVDESFSLLKRFRLPFVFII